MEMERYVTVAFSYLHDREKARDIFSDCYAYILERRDVLDGDLAGMKGYLMQAVRHRCLDELRKDSVRQAAFRNLCREDEEYLADDNVTRRMEESDVRELMRNAGVKMKKLTFDIYVMSRFAGLSHKEIAEQYGITRNRVAKEIIKAGKVMEMLVSRYLHLLVLAVQLLGTICITEGIRSL